MEGRAGPTKLLMIGDAANAQYSRPGVEALPWVPSTELTDAVLPTVDVLVHPARAEGYGLIVAEAQAAGVPVICSGAGALPEIVVHGTTGFVLTELSADQLAHRMVQLARDPDLRSRMGAAAMARHENRDSFSAMAAALGDVYRAAQRSAASRP
jgi:glycosyltransferase involved in cell wall biosynthesis